MWTDRTRSRAAAATGCLVLTILLAAACRSKNPCEDCDGDNLVPPMGLVFSIPGGDLTFFSLADKRVKLVTPLNGWAVVAAATSANGELMAIADAATDRMVMLRLPGLGSIVTRSLGGTPTDIEMDRLGVLLYATTINGNFWRYNIASGSIDTLEIELRPRRFALRPPERQQAWILCSGNATLHVMDLRNFTPLDTVVLEQAATDVVFSPSGEQAYLAVGGSPGRLAVMDADTRAEVDFLEISGGPFDLAISSDGRFVAASDSSGGRLAIWEVAAGNFWILPLAGSPGRVCFRYNTNCCFVLVYGVNRVYEVTIGSGHPAVTDSVAITANVRDLVLWEYRH